MRRKTAWIFLGVLTVALLMRLPFLSKEFVLEEALHVKVAKAIAQTGFPKIYYSEQVNEGIFLERTPVFFIPIALTIKLLGTSEIAIRTTLLLFSILEILIVMLLVRKIFANNNGSQISILSGLLMASSPYLIQTNLQIHFESAIFTSLISLYMLLSLLKISKKQNTNSDHFQLGLIYLVAFSVKYETSLMALIAVLIFAFIYFREFLPKLIISSVSAIIFFQVLFYLYNTYFNYPELTTLPAQSIFWVFENVFSPKFTLAQTSTQAISLWANNYYLLIRFLSWISIPAIILFFASAVQLTKNKVLFKNPKVVFALIWFFLFSATYLVGGWSGDYPRYFATAMPAFFIIISIALTHQIASVKKEGQNLRLPMVAFAAFVLFAIAQKNGFLFLDHITGWIPTLQTPFLIITFALLGITLIILFKTRFFSKYFVLLLILYLGQIFFQFNHDLKSTYSLTNFYGASNFKQSADFIKSTLSSQSTILTIDPIGYYWDGKFYDFYYFGTRNKNPELIANALKSGAISAIVLPKTTMQELLLSLKLEGINFEDLKKQRFFNHYQYPDENGVEIYY